MGDIWQWRIISVECRPMRPRYVDHTYTQHIYTHTDTHSQYDHNGFGQLPHPPSQTLLFALFITHHNICTSLSPPPPSFTSLSPTPLPFPPLFCQVLRRLLGQAKSQPSSATATSSTGHPPNARRSVSIQVGQGGKAAASSQKQPQAQLESVVGVVGVAEDAPVNNNNNNTNTTTADNNDDTNNDNNDTEATAGGDDAATPRLLDQGQVAWQQHLQRNRSCVVDLFQVTRKMIAASLLTLSTPANTCY